MSSPAIKLSVERHAQIKAISTALGLSISEVIARFVNSEIDAGTIPPDIAGLDIQRQEDGFLIGIDDQPAVHFSDEAAANLASTLREFADPQKRAEKVVNMQHNFIVERKGNGVKLTVPFTGKTTKSYSRDLARDIAALLVA